MDKDANSGIVCTVCGSKGNLKRCTRCKGAVYCCRQHQIQDWPSHKLNCTLNQAKDTVTKQKVNESPDEKDTCEKNESTDSAKKPVAINGDFIEFDRNPFKESNFKKPSSFEASKLAEFVIHYLNKNNFCIVDGIFSDTHLQKALNEIKSLNSDGCLKLGRLSGGRTSAQEALKVTKTEIRNDTIYWAEGTESRHPNINKVVQKMDSILSTLNNYFNDKYFINGRTKAMIACYPGNGSYYRRHVDNPRGDGRVITCILYLNRDWKAKEDGGVLRIFSAQDDNDFIDVSPVYNRMLFFWSDRRNPHEVQPAFRTRYAITVWFFDKAERERAKVECSMQDVSALKNEMMFLELEKMESEKSQLEQKIEQEAKKAIKSLTKEELQALADLVRGHEDPKGVLSQMGISASIQNHLLEELKQIDHNKS